MKVTAANQHDVCMMAELLTGEEQVVYGDSGYLGAEKRTEAVTRNKTGKRIHYKINRRPSQSKHNSNRSRAQIKRREREKSSIRAKVEDNELNAEILEEMLKIVGDTVDIYENGQMVVDVFERSSPGQYTAILMDVQMPVMNGLEATRAIRASIHLRLRFQLSQ